MHTNLGELLNSLRLARAVSYKMAMPTAVYTSTCTGTGTGVARVWVRALNRLEYELTYGRRTVTLLWEVPYSKW